MIKRILHKVYKFMFDIILTKRELIERHGGKVGSSVFLGDDVLIDYDFAFLLEIGDGAVIAARTIIELHDSSLPNVLNHGKNKIGKVKIGNNAYIGVNSVILPGVRIGDCSIVGACSLVNSDIPSKQVWGGIPARYICSVEELEEKRKSDGDSMAGYFDWVGELEKNKSSYKKLKGKLIRQVKNHFNEFVE